MDSWINPTSVVGGVLAVATAADLSAVYLVLGRPTPDETGESRRRGADRATTDARPSRASGNSSYQVMPSRLISGNDGPSDDPPEELR